MKLFLPLCILFFLLTNIAWAQHTSVLTQHNNNTRAGWNNHETTLTPRNVNATQFGKAFSLDVDDQVFSQPLVVGDLTISGAKHNVVYIATVNNSIYAYDGDNGTLYWQKNYTVAGYRPPRNTDMTYACGGFYFDFSGNIGIVGTPVIDSVAQTIYFVARSTNGNGTYIQYLHAVSLIDGSERANSPVQITASCAGNGEGSVNGVVSFDPQKNNQRQALTLTNGTLYIVFSSHCDWSPYHGWILGYDASTLTQKIVYNDTPNGTMAGIWQAGGGAAVDDNGNLYVVTGNGTVGDNGDPTNVVNRGESALKLTPSGNTLTVSSYFTPMDYPDMENHDLDYGGTGNFLIPNSNYYLTGSKEGVLHLLNKDNMGGYSSTSDNIQQTVPLNPTRTLRCQPTYFKGVNSEFVYVWSENDLLTALPFNRTTNMLKPGNQIVSTVQGPVGASGAELAVSSNGGNNGILWAAYSSDGDANQSVRPGILRAFDANDVSHELWNNKIMDNRDDAGNFAKFAAPTIANGHVYLATFSNKIAVYGIIADSTAGSLCPTTNLALNKPAFASSAQDTTVTPASFAFDGDTTTRWSSTYADPQWIYVDLGQADSICRVILKWETALGKDYTIQVSNDAQNWTTAATRTSNTSITDYIDVTAQARYVRMYGTARGTPYGYSLFEFIVNGKVLDTCKKPANLSTAAITTTSAVLKWAPTSAASYILKYNISTSNQFKTITTTADSVILTGLGCSTSYTWQVAPVCGGVTGTYSSTSAFSTQNCVNCSVMPTRVISVDIGSITIPGQACFSAPTSYTLKSSGDIFSASDKFHYVYKTFAGDGTLQAKVTSLDNIDPNNKAGLMFRESSDSSSSNVFFGLTSGNGITMQDRNITGGTTFTGNLPGVKPPLFLRLVRQGVIYTAYASSDSVNWLEFQSVRNFMSPNSAVSGGLAVSSHENDQTSTAQFDQVGFYPAGGGLVNIALNKPAYGSNYSDLNHTGTFANDGDLTTNWTSLGGTNPQWYYVDFGQPFKLNRIDINWGANYAITYQVQVSNDAITWRNVQNISRNDQLDNSIIMSDTARFLRINGMQNFNSNGYTINELQAFGDTIATVSDDIARGKTVYTSSDAGAGFSGSNITDGDFTTRWASKPLSNLEGFGIDLGNLYNLNNVNITWELDNAKDFVIQMSNNGTNWATLKSITGNTAYTNFVPVTGVGRFIRVYGTSRNGGSDYSIYDVQVLGTPYIPLPPGTPITIGGFSVYPNPTNGNTTISFNSLINQTVEVIISDMNGHLINDFTVPNVQGPQSFAAGFGNLMSGRYTVTLKTAQWTSSVIVIKL